MYFGRGIPAYLQRTKISCLQRFCQNVLSITEYGSFVKTNIKCSIC